MDEKNSNDKVLHALADLHEAVGKGFEKVHNEFAEIGDRFEKVDRQLLEIRGQLDRIETIILQDHERRLEVIEKNLGASRK